MSSVIFVINETEVILGTDTLAVPYEAEGGTCFFSSKAYSLPHMNMIMAASGDTNFLEKWWMYLNAHTVYPGIESVSWSAQANLQKMWREHKAEKSRPESCEQAIYMFGISEFTGEVLGFTHVSFEDDFRAEEISFRAKGQPMIFAKPNCTIPENSQELGIVKTFFTMMLDQRARQVGKLYPGSDGRARIGGELQIHHLAREGCAVYKPARFDDYDDVEKALWGDFRAAHAAKLAQRQAAPQEVTR